uniref:CCHC-type domain-containing protein n=1 Tax=Fagus sylvatica TaxID=28930 RepID=A0A2N9I2Q1_FAGSY
MKIGGLGLFDSSKCLVLCYFSSVVLAFGFSMDKLVTQTSRLGWAAGLVSLELEPGAEDKAKLMLLGKVLSSRPFSRGVVKEIIAKAWNTVNEVDVAGVDKNVFLFTFKHEVDMRKVWDRRHWSFKGKHLILKKYNPDWSLNEVDFSKTDLWVQVHGLSLNRQGEVNLKKIGHMLGTILEVDVAGSGPSAGMRFVRIHIRVAVNHPLAMGFPIGRERLLVLWVPFKYKKLGSVCYGCGHIGHEGKNCSVEGIRLLSNEQIFEGIYGNWLREGSTEYQPGIDLEGLISSDWVECTVQPIQGASTSNVEHQTPMDHLENWVDRGQVVGTRYKGLVLGESQKSEQVACHRLLSCHLLTAVEKSQSGDTAMPRDKQLPIHSEPSRAPTVFSIRAFVKGEGPDVLFVSEIKVSSPKMEKLNFKMGFANCFAIDSRDRASGLALFWKMGVELEVVFSNKNAVAALVFSNPPENLWLLLVVYGDFNSIVRGSEKQRGSSFGAELSKSLQNFMNDVGTIDLGFCGSKFTWSNRRAGLANIRERLDKGICNADWQTLFPKAGVKHLTAANSDHCPIILDTSMELRKGVRPFRFEAMWTKDRSNLGVIENAWASEVEGYQKFKLPKKLMRTSKELIAWNKSTFGYAQDLEGLLSPYISEAENSKLSRIGMATGRIGIGSWVPRPRPALWLEASAKVIPKPYLFILCMDVLAKLIDREVSRRALKGVLLALGAPSISKLLYADDVLLFCGACRKEVKVLLNCVELFCKWFGQTISIEKSGWFVSKGNFKHPKWSIAQEDSWIWVKTNNGDFSIKSAFQEVYSCEGTGVDSLLSQIWKLNIHNRLKMLLWRIASDILPTYNLLVRFNPSILPFCPLCEIALESPIHVFWECHFARSLWFGCDWGIMTEYFQFLSARDLIKAVIFPPEDVKAISGGERKFMLLGAIILDVIWKSRNLKVHENKVIEVGRALRSIQASFCEHGLGHSKPNVSNSSVFVTRWEKPGRGVIKLNFDAAIGMDFSYVAVVARDWRGELVFALSKKAKTIIPLQAEMEAIWWSMQLALSHGFSAICFESDSSSCIEALLKPAASIPWRIRRCVLDVLSLAADFPDWSFRWIHREANGAADSLAKWTACISSSVV